MQCLSAIHCSKDVRERDDPGLEATVVGRTIRKLRQERKLSLQSLASEAEMSVSMLSQIERGVSTPSLKSLTKIRLARACR